ncbi:alpha/beta hydrolase [Bdellovibrio sp. HCB-162]|uniref:alpha/beta hydrolase n=1 Tax=Bdellovibrio sp. HCB-162 TaxID=3394234 RepID=UPI0039BCAD95
MIKKSVLFFSLLFVSSLSFADVEYLRLSPGKVIAYEHIVKNQNGDTLILLPGVNRALNPSDRAVRALAQQGWNILMPSLPAHPLSVKGLKSSEVPYFKYDSSVRVKDFAGDVEALTAHLGIKKAIPVTLSYSSSIGAYLNEKLFPHVIETVPLGIATEGDPESAKNAELWENWLRLNPFMAPFWIRQFRDTAYATHWGQTVDANLKADADFYGENPRVADIKSGYVTIARAVEDFNFPEWDFRNEKRTRDFVFAGQENPERLKNQIEVLKHYLTSGKPVRVLVVANAGHILPTDDPTVYAGVLTLLATQSRQSSVQFAIVNSAESLKSLRWQDGSALENWIKANQR